MKYVFYIYSPPQFRPVTFQGSVSSHMWLVVAVLNYTDIEHFYHHRKF